MWLKILGLQLGDWIFIWDGITTYIWLIMTYSHRIWGDFFCFSREGGRLFEYEGFNPPREQNKIVLIRLSTFLIKFHINCIVKFKPVLGLFDLDPCCQNKVIIFTQKSGFQVVHPISSKRSHIQKKMHANYSKLQMEKQWKCHALWFYGFVNRRIVWSQWKSSQKCVKHARNRI